MSWEWILIWRKQGSIRFKFWDENVKFFLMVWLDLDSAINIRICFMNVLNLDDSVNDITVFWILDVDVDWNKFSEEVIRVVAKCKLKLLFRWGDFNRHLICSSWDHLGLFRFVDLDQLIFLFFMIHVRIEWNVNHWSVFSFFDQNYLFKYQSTFKSLRNENFEFFNQILIPWKLHFFCNDLINLQLSWKHDQYLLKLEFNQWCKSQPQLYKIKFFSFIRSKLPKAFE